MRILLFVMTLLLSVEIEAQKKEFIRKVDTLSIKTLIYNFYRYKVKEASYNINQYDCFVKYHSSDEEMYFEVSPLKELKGIQIHNCRGEWDMAHENGQISLFLTKILPLNGATKEYAEKIYVSLEKKYGKIASKGIPAKWVNGKYSILYCLSNLFGEIVSRSESIYDFRSGIQISEIRGVNGGTMEQLKDIVSNRCWYDNLPVYMRYLSRFVNSCRKVSNNSNVEKRFALLLFTDLKGQSQVICLNKKEVIEANRVILDDLKKCIKELPANSFGYLKTLQGKTFQGRYLTGIYIGRLGWFFTDYINSF